MDSTFTGTTTDHDEKSLVFGNPAALVDRPQ
jgi:hypothetical protein